MTTLLIAVAGLSVFAYLVFRLMRWARGGTRGASVLGAVLTELLRALSFTKPNRVRNAKRVIRGTPRTRNEEACANRTTTGCSGRWNGTGGAPQVRRFIVHKRRAGQRSAPPLNRNVRRIHQGVPTFMGNGQVKTSTVPRHFSLVRLLLCVVAVAAPLATAQNPLAPRGAERSPGCLRASRAKDSCDPVQVVVRIEKEVAFSLDLPPVKLVQCAPTIELAYSQRDTMVSVEGTVENKDCGPSSGDYNLVVSIRNENHELTTVEFLESWRRQDDQPVRFAGTYPIGENVDVVRVRPFQLRCTCADTAEN